MLNVTNKGKKYFSNTKTDTSNLKTNGKDKSDEESQSAMSDQLISTLPSQFQEKIEEMDLDPFDEID